MSKHKNSQAVFPFTDSDLTVLLEVARYALKDATTFDNTCDALDIADGELCTLRDRLTTYMQQDGAPIVAQHLELRRTLTEMVARMRLAALGMYERDKTERACKAAEELVNECTPQPGK